MKVNFQRPNKVLCIILAATICVCACVVSVSADDYSGLAGIAQNDVNYIKQTLENAKKLVNGEITVQDAFYSQMTNATELVSENVKDINPFQSETELTGVTNRDYANKLTKSVRDCLDTHGIDYGKTEVTEDVVDMHGYSSALGIPQSDGSFIWHYGQDGLFRSNGRTRITQFLVVYPNGYTETFVDGSYFSSAYSSNNLYLGVWLYEDGSPADDKTTPAQNTIQTNDPSTLTDTQLIDLLEDLLLNLKLDYPDLSTIEGLLSAILAQCQSINGKICTSSEIRSMLDDAISKINNGGGGMSDDDIEKITCALDNLKYGNI